MNSMPPDKGFITITNDSWLSERDLIRIRDNQYALIYRANVRTATGEKEHLIISPLPHFIDQAERDAIIRNLRETTPQAAISFFIADREGWAHVITESDEELNPFNIAAAIAVIKASCGWDESSSMIVIVNSDEVRVCPRFDGQHWIADDREETL